jgi:hypothetical protein
VALSELYMKLETGHISEAEFDAQEKVLLDRLDRLQAAEESGAALEEQPAKPRPKAKGGRKKAPPVVKPSTIV